MKKVSMLATAILLTLVCALQAQTTKGTFALSLHNFSPLIPEASGLLAPTNALGIAFGTTKSESGIQDREYSYTTLGLSGSGHYFIIDNLSAGINLNLLYQKEKEKNAVGTPDEYSVTIFMAGPEVRYYIPAGAKTKVWINGSGGVGSVTSGDDDDDSDPTKLSRFGGGVGLAIFPVEKVSIDLGLGYGIFTSKDTFEDFDGDIIEVKNTNSGVVVDLGFSVFF